MTASGQLTGGNPAMDPVVASPAQGHSGYLPGLGVTLMSSCLPRPGDQMVLCEALFATTEGALVIVCVYRSQGYRSFLSMIKYQLNQWLKFLLKFCP